MSNWIKADTSSPTIHELIRACVAILDAHNHALAESETDLAAYKAQMEGPIRALFPIIQNFKTEEPKG